MIELKLIRQTPKDINQSFTHGQLFIKDNLGKWLDFCYTLEDTVRDINMNGKFDNGEQKIDGKTAIPFGKYKGQITYSPTFKRDMPLIKDVPEFEGVRMHGGNTDKDSLGCILIAHNTDNNGKIWGSSESDLTCVIKQNGNIFTIQII